ncbi:MULTISPECIES: outer membrane lipoprotein-sorting protein [unclassified Vibrio]|uniref:outer membrane lipoprotein-sorting protein n=1 Tax=unclassified Vibrio TaxID=2614977 RepID=UPI000C85D661|nr:outer membrane lipoprotein-sorting protein [Vibrio sp. 10N.286.48.B7]
MYKSWLITIKLRGIVAMLVSAASVSALASEAESLIKQADSYRLDAGASRVVSEVRLYQDDKLDKTRLYDVYLKPNRESLVVFKANVEKGQKMLMLGDNYWLLMPKSRRPIRITPMQKLLGEASVGDISTLTWSQDYQGQVIENEDILALDGSMTKTKRLKLVAKTAGASYQQIDLWLDNKTAFPIQADLYLRSGKLAKKAQFEQGVRNGERRVTAMILRDQIQMNKKTVIDYQSIEPHSLPSKYYNPAFLSKNKQLGIE